MRRMAKLARERAQCLDFVPSVSVDYRTGYSIGYLQGFRDARADMLIELEAMKEEYEKEALHLAAEGHRDAEYFRAKGFALHVAVVRAEQLGEEEVEG